MLDKQDLVILSERAGHRALTRKELRKLGHFSSYATMGFELEEGFMVFEGGSSSGDDGLIAYFYTRDGILLDEIYC